MLIYFYIFDIFIDLFDIVIDVFDICMDFSILIYAFYIFDAFMGVSGFSRFFASWCILHDICCYELRVLRRPGDLSDAHPDGVNPGSTPLSRLKKMPSNQLFLGNYTLCD